MSLAIWITQATVVVILFTIASVTMYRHCHLRQQSSKRAKAVHQLWKIRYLSMICVLLQTMTFLGYFTNSLILSELGWTFWVPCHTIALSFLSYNIVSIYLSTRSLVQLKQHKSSVKSMKSLKSLKSKSPSMSPRSPPSGSTNSNGSGLSDSDDIDLKDDNDSKNGSGLDSGDESELNRNQSLRRADSLRTKEYGKYNSVFWKWVWIIWALSTIVDWLGSIFGWILGLYTLQAFMYAIWKLIAFIMLLLCIKVINKVYKRVVLVQQKQKDVVSSEMAKKFKEGVIRIKRLLICMIFVAVAMIASSIWELYLAIEKLEDHSADNNIFATFLSSLFYFPLWTFVNIILLYYAWIPSSKKNKRKDTKDVSKAEATGGTSAKETTLAESIEIDGE